jgi:hypothetical protein
MQNEKYIKMIIKIRINRRGKEVKFQSGCRVRRIRNWAQMKLEGRRRTVCGRHLQAAILISDHDTATCREITSTRPWNSRQNMFTAPKWMKSVTRNFTVY